MLFAHITPGMFERFYGNYDDDYYGWYWFKPDFNRRYLDIVEKYADVITGQVWLNTSKHFWLA